MINWFKQRPATLTLSIAVFGGIAIWLYERHIHEHAASALGWFFFCGVMIGSGIILRSEKW